LAEQRIRESKPDRLLSIDFPDVLGPAPAVAMRAGNAIGAALRGLGLRSPRLDVPALLRASGVKHARLDEADDAAFRDRLQTLLDDANGPARLNYLGRWNVRARLAGVIATRLRVRQWLADHPRTLDVPVERPLFVVGPPRTGTTLLYLLLALDPQVRAPRWWEVVAPVPPPVPDGERDDPRYRRCERDLARLHKYLPNLAVAHELGAADPHECNALLEASALSLTFLLYLHAPTYANRLQRAAPAEAQEAYALFRRQVQILLMRAEGRRWVSKSPAHLGFLDSLATAFPDGGIVSTHREPLQSIPSICSLAAMTRSVSSDDVDLADVGRAMLDGFVEAARRADAARAKMAPARVVDIAYPRLVADPVGTVRDLYAHFGYPYTPLFERRMRAWLAAHPPHPHGVHRYSLGQFGLDREEVFAATDDYRRRYL
jgi:hypothetical protein